MWKLYCDFEDEFENQSVFNPAALLARQTPAQPGPATAPQMPVPSQMPPQAPFQGNPGGLPPQVQQMIAGQLAMQHAPAPTVECELLNAMIESRKLSSKYTTLHRFTPLQLAPLQQAIKDEILNQGWSHSPAPTA
jgi:hypothetical protein